MLTPQLPLHICVPYAVEDIWGIWALALPLEAGVSASCQMRTATLLLEHHVEMPTVHDRILVYELSNVGFNSLARTRRNKIVV
jgi:hypothetical protein